MPPRSTSSAVVFALTVCIASLPSHAQSRAEPEHVARFSRRRPHPGSWPRVVMMSIFSGFTYGVPLAVAATTGPDWPVFVVPTTGPIIWAGMATAACPRGYLCNISLPFYWVFGIVGAGLQVVSGIGLYYSIRNYHSDLVDDGSAPRIVVLPIGPGGPGISAAGMF